MQARYTYRRCTMTRPRSKGEETWKGQGGEGASICATILEIYLSPIACVELEGQEVTEQVTDSNH